HPPAATSTFPVRPTDPAGTPGAAAASDYLLDTTAPAAPTITSSPTTPDNSLTPSWSFAGEAGATFECRLTRGALVVWDWSTCTSPHGYHLTGQPAGTYAFALRPHRPAGAPHHHLAAHTGQLAGSVLELHRRGRRHLRVPSDERGDGRRRLVLLHQPSRLRPHRPARRHLHVRGPGHRRRRQHRGGGHLRLPARHHGAGGTHHHLVARHSGQLALALVERHRCGAGNPLVPPD